jgi:hypothetical protein
MSGVMPFSGHDQHERGGQGHGCGANKGNQLKGRDECRLDRIFRSAIL